MVLTFHHMLKFQNIYILVPSVTLAVNDSARLRAYYDLLLCYLNDWKIGIFGLCTPDIPEALLQPRYSSETHAITIVCHSVYDPAEDLEGGCENQPKSLCFHL